MEESYLIFSDESGYIGKHRFRSVCTVSGSRSNLKELNETLKVILTQTRKTEIKFSKINNHSTNIKCSKEFYCKGLEYCSKGKIKIYVITWDIQDSRHSVIGRDDIENLQIMYYQLLKVTMQHWGNLLNWEFYPDQFSAIDWPDFISYLRNTNLLKKREWENNLFGLVRNLSFPNIEKHLELESHKFPVIQLADLFAGGVRFTHNNGKNLQKWIIKQNAQNSLFPIKNSIVVPKKQLARFEVLAHLKQKSKHLKLGINLSKNFYFHTFNAKNNIFFWKYDPQGDYDKAPIKNS